MIKEMIYMNEKLYSTIDSEEARFDDEEELMTFIIENGDMGIRYTYGFEY